MRSRPNELGRFFEIPEKKILAAIHAYHGAWRRMELRGKFKGAPVYDDYAHHPTEIAATLQAFREKFPKKKILVRFPAASGPAARAPFQRISNRLRRRRRNAYLAALSCCRPRRGHPEPRFGSARPRDPEKTAAANRSSTSRIRQN